MRQCHADYIVAATAGGVGSHAPPLPVHLNGLGMHTFGAGHAHTRQAALRGYGYANKRGAEGDFSSACDGLGHRGAALVHQLEGSNITAKVITGLTSLVGGNGHVLVIPATAGASGIDSWTVEQQSVCACGSAMVQQRSQPWVSHAYVTCRIEAAAAIAIQVVIPKDIPEGPIAVGTSGIPGHNSVVDVQLESAPYASAAAKGLILGDRAAADVRGANEVYATSLIRCVAAQGTVANNDRGSSVDRPAQVPAVVSAEGAGFDRCGAGARLAEDSAPLPATSPGSQDR